MSEFKYVPQHVIDMALAALEHLPEDVALFCVEKKGSYSAYEYTFTSGDAQFVTRQGYDFGLQLPVDERGAALAAVVLPLLGIESPPVQNIDAGDVNLQASVDLSPAETPMPESGEYTTAQIVFDGPEAEQAFYEALVEADEPIDYEAMSVAELKELAAAVGIDLPARPKKPEIIAALIEYDAAHTTPQGEEETE